MQSWADAGSTNRFPRKTWVILRLHHTWFKIPKTLDMTQLMKDHNANQSKYIISGWKEKKHYKVTKLSLQSSSKFIEELYDFKEGIYSM